MADKKKNCLLIVIDCLRADKAWDPEIKTPTIDYLTENGTSFTKTIATTSTTTPSFASLLSGLYPPHHGILSLSGYKINKDISLLAETFKKNGYNTYAEVTGPLLPLFGIERGFDSYNCRESEEGIDSEWYDQLVKQFSEEDLEEPWFMLLHIFDLHRGTELNLDNVEEGQNKYEKALTYIDSRLKRLVNNIDQEDTLLIFHADHGERIIENKFGEVLNKLKTKIRYLKMKLNMDAPETNPQVGHGFHVYDYLVRIPLIFVNEDLFAKDKSISKQVRQIDIAPTLVDCLGLDHKGTMDGKSVMDIIEGEDDEERLAYMVACGAVLDDKKYWRKGVRSERFKYIWAPYNDDMEDELYDLEKDPKEKRNIISQKKRIAKKLKRYAKEVERNDTCEDR